MISLRLLNRSIRDDWELWEVRNNERILRSWTLFKCHSPSKISNVIITFSIGKFVNEHFCLTMSAFHGSLRFSSKKNLKRKIHSHRFDIIKTTIGFYVIAIFPCCGSRVSFWNVEQDSILWLTTWIIRNSCCCCFHSLVRFNNIFPSAKALASHSCVLCMVLRWKENSWSHIFRLHPNLRHVWKSFNFRIFIRKDFFSASSNSSAFDICAFIRWWNI